MLQKKFRTVIIKYFMGKLLSEMILDLGNCPCTFTFMHFLVGALTEVQNHFRKQFSHKVIYNNCSKFFVAFWSVFKKVKNGFPIVLSKTDMSDVQGYFHI